MVVQSIPLSPSARERAFAWNFAQVYSPCGRFLAVGGTDGRVVIFRMTSVLREQTPDCAPLAAIKCGQGSIYALASTEHHLICASEDGVLYGYAWKDLPFKGSKPDFRIDTNVRNVSSNGKRNEINALLVSPDGETVFVGGGNGQLLQVDIEHQMRQAEFRGHSDTVLCLASTSGGADFLSGGEDGSLLLWDARSKQVAGRMEPYKNKECARPEIGKWIGAVATDSAWIVCGGGPELSMWHLGSLTLAKVLPTNSVQHKSILFYEDKVLTNGRRCIQQWNMLGECLANVPSAINSIYSLAVNHVDPKVLTAAGTKAEVDVLLTAGYVAFTLDAYVPVQ